MNQPSFYQPIATLVQAVFTLIVGAGVATIAFLQWKTARDKLRLDLFDRRYKVYEATINFIACAIVNAQLDFEVLHKFDTDTSDSQFLFGSDVVRYLAVIRERATKKEQHRKMRVQATADAERTRHEQAENAEMNWLWNQSTETTRVFAPYLSYSNIKR